MKLSRIISSSLSPNTEPDDAQLALRTFFSPWCWKKNSALVQVGEWFSKYFPGFQIEFFNSGRSALLALLKSFEIGQDDEVLVQAFTCVAVPNSIIWAGAKPVYVDIDETFNMNVKDIQKKITKNTKALIVQHTFGIAADMNQVSSFCKKHKILLIEDCAHALGATYNGEKLGSIGDAAFFSFGRDKVISSVWGGAAIINSPARPGRAKLAEYQKSLSYPSHFWILQQLLHPIAFSIILPLYSNGIGKIILLLMQKMKLLSIPVYSQEKRGIKPEEFPKKYPNALAMLLVNQLKKLDKYNLMRRQTAKFYRESFCAVKNIELPKIREGSIYLRYPLLAKDLDQMRQIARRSGIILGNWYHNIIDPKGVDYEAVGYKKGSCPKAEKYASRIINLPTRISLSEAVRVVEAVKMIQ